VAFGSTDPWGVFRGEQLSHSPCNRSLYLTVSPVAASTALASRFLQFSVHFVQINQCATDFFGQVGVFQEEVCPLCLHSLEQRAQDIKVTPKPATARTEYPNTVFL
jgi:hypothetical protein